jgi:hypothetical protein
MSVNIPEIERILFFPGQRLLAADLTALETTNRELRWLHNRTLHPWGIGAGLEVSGQKGDTSVTTQPGFAVDRLGRELVLASPRTLPIPAVPGSSTGGQATFYLVARYLADGQQGTLETRAGVCQPGGSVRLSDEPSIEWRTASTIDEGMDVILASIQVKNCMLWARASSAPRRYVLPLNQPYLASGRTPAGSTDWQPLIEGGSVVGQFVHVDASQGNFRAIPQYLVNIPGARVRFFPLLVALGVSEIANANVTGFTLRVLFPVLPGGPELNPPELRDATNGPKALNQLGWCVSWVGIEA